MNLKPYISTHLFMHFETPGDISFEHFVYYFDFLTETDDIESNASNDYMAMKRHELTKNLDNFTMLVDLQKNKFYQENLVKTISDSTKEKVSGVLAKYGISIRTMAVLLIVSVVIIIFMFMLIMYAQVAFGSPGMLTSALSSLLCLGGTFGINKGFTKQNTSPSRISKITESSGQELQNVTPNLDAAFSRSLKNSIKKAAADQKKKFS